MTNDNYLEIRSVDFKLATVDPTQRIISGRAIAYNSLSKPLKMANGDTFREMLMPGAMTDSIQNNDICAYKEHNPELLLGRTSSGTLKLDEDAQGVNATIQVPNTTYGNDVLESAKRGDVRGFSFGFRAVKTKNYTRADGKIRELHAIDCKEISTCSSPAYPETTLACRSEDFVEETRDALTTADKKELAPSDFVFPDTKEYPIPDIEHGRKALQLGAKAVKAGTLSAAKYQTIKDVVQKKYPDIKIDGMDDGDRSTKEKLEVRTRKKVKVKVDEDTDVEVENTPAEVVVVKEEVKPVPVDQLTQDFYARKQRFHDLQEKI